MSPPRPIRLWPAWIILVIQAATLILQITPTLSTGMRFGFMMLGPLVCVFLYGIWLLFASRLSWRERLLIIAGTLVFGIPSALLTEPKTRVALWIYAVPLAMLVVSAVLHFARERARAQRLTLALSGLFLVFASWTILRIDGFDGTYLPQVAWRWSPTPEDRLVTGLTDTTPASLSGAAVDRAADTAAEAPAPMGDEQLFAPPEWPGFRGPGRDGLSALDKTLDWQTAPPRERWRIPVGPAWSSFAYAAGKLYTQEQRGEEEAVTCLDAETGARLWSFGYPSRFDEVVSGAGPRATPTLAGDRLFALGARALLCALDAETGELIWQRDLMAELGAPLPVWGFSSSPLVIADKVIVYAGGNDDNGLVAYTAASGEPSWRIASRGMNFSSAQLVTLAGTEMVLFADSAGVMAVLPADGRVAWRFKPSNWAGPPIVQAQQIGPEDLVVPLGDSAGVARLTVTRVDDSWQVAERWTSRDLKPSFNDFVYHEGFLYGFDKAIFVCVDAESGTRRWKRGRYGFGQVVLSERGQLVIQGEKGDVILLAADPTEHRELGRLASLEGKTWNHPIIANGHLFVRNGIEAVGLELVSLQL